MDGSFAFFGLLQGITEFLPISSSGHLLLMDELLSGAPLSLSLVLLLHLATFGSVLAVFFKDIKSFILSLSQKTGQKMALKILTSLAPLILVGWLFKSFVEQSFTVNIAAWGFLSTGGLLLSLFFIRSRQRGRRGSGRAQSSQEQSLSLDKMSFSQAFLIGLAQTLAILPGFSRAGWTIAAGLFCGLPPRGAVYYSFLISLPAIAGSAFMDFASYLAQTPSDQNLSWLLAPELSRLLAFLTAFCAGWLSLTVVLKTAQSERLHLFSFYLLPLAGFVFFFL